MQCHRTSDCGDPDVFRGDIAPCEHRVEFFARDDGWLEALAPFVSTGLAAGDGVMIVATGPHLLALEARLERLRADLDAVRQRDQYLALDAEATLARFMEGGWPNADQFQQWGKTMLGRARGPGRRVRACSEMAGLLAARGYPGASVQLEHMWHDLCRRDASSLFCLYPQAGLTPFAEESERELGAAESRLVTARGS